MSGTRGLSGSEYDPNFGWGPAIPLPLYAQGWFGMRKRYGCTCGEEFRSEGDYREHYARNHWEGSQ